MVIRVTISIAGDRLFDNDFTSINLYQQIDEHHTFDLSLRQGPNKGALGQKASSWVGKQVKIGFDYKSDKDPPSSLLPDTFIGVATSISLSRQRGTTELVLHGHSPTVLLDDGLNTRSFTDKGLQEIADEVLGPYSKGFQTAPNVEPKFFTKALPYLVQYNESNFNFLYRLANRYGEWFFYDGLRLHFGKPSNGENPVQLDFEKDGLDYFNLSIRAIPNKFEMRGYDYTIHKDFQEEAPFSSKTNELGNKVVEVAKSKIFPQSPSVSIQTALDQAELKNLALRREQATIDEVVILQGSSRNPKIKIGARIKIKDNEVQEDHGVFVITSLTHTIKQGGDYSNHFEAIPEEVQSPPISLVPNPPFCEAQLAEVTDIDDDKKLGRVRVKFLWQEGTQEKSPWIRVASPYTGKDKGFYIVPEIGDQVLVAFENNNPDKPYVLTGMYNGEAKPEWFEPKNRYKGFKSKGQNEWQFDDKEQHIRVRAPKSLELSAGKKIDINTDGESDSEITIDAGQGTINVKANIINIEGATVVDVKGGIIKLNS